MSKIDLNRYRILGYILNNTGPGAAMSIFHVNGYILV
jgi:hypothetical protein